MLIRTIKSLKEKFRNLTNLFFQISFIYHCISHVM